VEASTQIAQVSDIVDGNAIVTCKDGGVSPATLGYGPKSRVDL
jgi:hypothetical protein